MDATVTVPKRVPRAVRNNNPGNIRIGDPWQGLLPADKMTPEQAGEHEFCVFQSPKWGFRALGRVLISYQDKYDLRTIRGVISRWAPVGENDTAAYIEHVLILTELSEDQQLDLHSFKDSRPLCKAIAVVESGAWLFEDADLDAGLTLAGVPPDLPALAKSKTMQTGVAGTAISIASAVEAVQQIKPAVDTISQVKEYWPVAAAVLFAVLFAYIVWRKIDDHVHARR